MKLTKLLQASLIVLFLASVTMINVSLASPATHFYIDPSLIQGTPEGKIQIAIRVADAPPSFSWEIHLSWDSEHLQLPVYKVWDPILGKWALITNITEGDFLHRWEANPFPPPDYTPKYATKIAYTSPDQANLNGEIIVSGTLVGAYPQSEWASGDGWLFSIIFTVHAEGAAHLNLFDTRLWDHLAGDPPYPAPTYYPNEDGLVDATSFFYAGLDGWKLKVNGKAGVGKGEGLATTVGTANVLEAFVSNPGTFAVYVQAFFEIRDSTGYWLATVPSSTVLLPSGGSTTFSATWTAKGAGVYYITAYSLYGPLTPNIQDSFSRTLRLKAV